jgi:outer membrane lipoprotein SlyB
VTQERDAKKLEMQTEDAMALAWANSAESDLIGGIHGAVTGGMIGGALSGGPGALVGATAGAVKGATDQEY